LASLKSLITGEKAQICMSISFKSKIICVVLFFSIIFVDSVYSQVESAPAGDSSASADSSAGADNVTDKQLEEEQIEPLGTVLLISVKKAKALHDDGIVFVDIRGDEAKERIPATLVIDFSKEESREFLKSEVGDDQDVVIYGSRENPGAVFKVVKEIYGWGHNGIFFFKDGIEGWKEQGYRVKVTE